MNSIRLLRLLPMLAFAVLSLELRAFADAPAGPNGGRVLQKVEPSAEFYVRPDRRVQITFLDPAGEPVAPEDQEVTIVAGQRSAPTTLHFDREGAVLVSREALPEGDHVPTVVQIRPSPGAAVAIERFNVNLARCPECGLGEYACTCHD